MQWTNGGDQKQQTVASQRIVTHAPLANLQCGHPKGHHEELMAKNQELHEEVTRLQHHIYRLKQQHIDQLREQWELQCHEFTATTSSVLRELHWEQQRTSDIEMELIDTVEQFQNDSLHDSCDSIHRRHWTMRLATPDPDLSVTRTRTCTHNPYHSTCDSIVSVSRSLESQLVSIHSTSNSINGF